MLLRKLQVWHSRYAPFAGRLVQVTQVSLGAPSVAVPEITRHYEQISPFFLCSICGRFVASRAPIFELPPPKLMTQPVLQGYNTRTHPYSRPGAALAFQKEVLMHFPGTITVPRHRLSRASALVYFPLLSWYGIYVFKEEKIPSFQHRRSIIRYLRQPSAAPLKHLNDMCALRLGPGNCLRFSKAAWTTHRALRTLVILYSDVNLDLLPKKRHSAELANIWVVDAFSR